MTTTTPILYRICKRPAGDFAIQKVLDGCLVRFGLYRTRRAAEANLAIANVPHRPFADTVRALSTEGEFRGVPRAVWAFAKFKTQPNNPHA